MPFFEQHKSLFRNPKKLADVVASLNADSEYAAIFVPGGHGALIGLPESQDVAAALQWAIKNDRFVISLCHGPAAFLALRHGDNPLNGYSICAFPDAADKQTPEIGYMPGHLTWYFGEELKKMGMNIINDDITGRVHKDRKVLTGDSPFAANALGKLAAQEMLAAYAD
ncbi:protein deglycase HchA, partial [Shigella sonnei]